MQKGGIILSLGSVLEAVSWRCLLPIRRSKAERFFFIFSANSFLSLVFCFLSFLVRLWMALFWVAGGRSDLTLGLVPVGLVGGASLGDCGKRGLLVWVEEVLSFIGVRFLRGLQ